ncbi:fucose-1-phosphate guanylyltransferase [Trichonephila clavata]|uniref:Fucose-1-phosphate guanylyltransferase n=1 Tax=Trichonephila clavata TaxID=2740835 RepID=A0A8X6J993_TRICU|nr:fucose-1-phosphate guanylyltransferase [Trichonephila clavata]
MNQDKNPSSILEYMLKVLDNYNVIRGKTVDLSQSLFWDAVIISASDSSQEEGYELQIHEKQQKGELPLSIPFHIFADPPGYKIGCGGSTMFILDKIFEIYGTRMYSMRFLLIPAGGYSQRLPNLSVLGKLFSPLPFGETRYQMLDLILAVYLPFLKHMPPGVFLASSDAIISFSLSDNDSWTFENEGFTALAHPSPVVIGTTHGVYVLPTNENVEEGSAFMSECIRVLQKPSVEEMHNKRAVRKSNSTIAGDEDEEIVFSDSAFFFDHSITKKLIKFYKNNKPLKCELSSYGDFLQPLGLSASPSYIINKITCETLASLRSALYKELHGTKLSILVLKNSNFHHLGTMQEYIESLCCKNKFADVFPISRRSFSIFSVRELISLYIQGTLVHSIVHPLSIIPESSVIEYCDVNVAMNIGNNCIISNIQLDGFAVQRLPFNIPDNTLLHTVVLKDGFVTIAFNVFESIKKSYKKENALETVFFRKKLKVFLTSDENVFSNDCDNVSLWEAKLFPICSTAEESFKETLEIIVCVNECDSSKLNFTLKRQNLKWVSMHDILLLKDTEAMVNYQKQLCEKIKHKK